MIDEHAMSDFDLAIKCKKCGGTFQPDMNTKGAWSCPNCHAKNPNLKRHYRSVADVCILGLIATVIIFVIGLNKRGLDLNIVLSSTHAVLLLVTIVLVYKSKAPWMDTTAKTLIWVVFGLALLFNVVVPLLIIGTLNIPALVIYAIVFPFLFWLNAQASKCTIKVPLEQTTGNA
jgi:hypothetical protein